VYVALPTPPIIREPLRECQLGTRTLEFILRVDEYPLDRGLPDLLIDQQNATGLSSRATRGARRGFRMVPIPRIHGTTQMVHMGPAHARLA